MVVAVFLEVANGIGSRGSCSIQSSTVDNVRCNTFIRDDEVPDDTINRIGISPGHKDCAGRGGSSSHTCEGTRNCEKHTTIHRLYRQHANKQVQSNNNLTRNIKNFLQK